MTNFSKPKTATHGLPKHFCLSSKCKKQLRKSNVVIGMLKFLGFNNFFLKGQTGYLKQDCLKYLAGFAAVDIEQMKQAPKLVTSCLPLGG